MELINKNSKLFKFIKKSLAILNALEGTIHIVVALVGFWGIYETNAWDFRVMLPPIENVIFGVFSLLTGYILGTDGHNH